MAAAGVTEFLPASRSSAVIIPNLEEKVPLFCLIR